LKRNILLISAAFSLLIIFVFGVWLFTAHGVGGMLHTDRTMRIILTVVFVPGLILLGLALWRFAARHHKPVRKWPKIVIIILTVYCVAMPATGFTALNIDLSPPVSEIVPQLIFTDNTGANGIPDIALVRYTPTVMRDFLVWGTEASSNSQTEDSSGLQHVFILRDLLPDTKYTYSINNGEEHSFKTPPADGGLHFAAVSDAHFGAGTNNTAVTAAIINRIADPADGFNCLFSLGDLVDMGFKRNDWQQAFDALSPVNSQIPAACATGNHDSILTGINNYEYYCSPEGVKTNSGSRLWYRMDIGKIHFLVLDVEWSAESYTQEQAKWFESQLRSIPADDWKIVICHGYYYASGTGENGWSWTDNPETINVLTPLFEKYHVDMVFSGHNHQLELLQKAGVTYSICGGSGGVLDAPRTYISPYSVWYGDEYGFADVTIDGNSAQITFRGPDGSALKNITVAK
jgi:acid phosphatase type 7